jgi:hypothetical protein
MNRVFSAAIIALLATGCVTKESVPARESAIEGVPVPATAEPYAMDQPGLRDDFKSDAYWAVDMTFDELDAWYELHMPKGRSWNDWNWHEPIPGRMYIARFYCHAVRDGISVTLIREEGGNPPGILVTQDGSGSGC